MNPARDLFELIQKRGEVLTGDMHIIKISGEMYDGDVPSINDDEVYRVYHRVGSCFDIKREYAGIAGSWVYTYTPIWDGIGKVTVAQLVEALTERFKNEEILGTNHRSEVADTPEKEKEVVGRMKGEFEKLKDAILSLMPSNQMVYPTKYHAVEISLHTRKPDFKRNNLYEVKEPWYERQKSITYKHWDSAIKDGKATVINKEEITFPTKTTLGELKITWVVIWVHGLGIHIAKKLEPKMIAMPAYTLFFEKGKVVFNVSEE